MAKQAIEGAKRSDSYAVESAPIVFGGDEIPYGQSGDEKTVNELLAELREREAADARRRDFEARRLKLFPEASNG